MREGLPEPLGAAAARAGRRLMADDGEERLLRDAAHVVVLAVAERRLEPEAAVVIQVAVPLEGCLWGKGGGPIRRCESLSRGAARRVRPPGRWRKKTDNPGEGRRTYPNTSIKILLYKRDQPTRETRATSQGALLSSPSWLTPVADTHRAMEEGLLAPTMEPHLKSESVVGLTGGLVTHACEHLHRGLCCDAALQAVVCRATQHKLLRANLPEVVGLEQRLVQVPLHGALDPAIL